MKRFYRRFLPHQVPEDSPIFLTWNLHGAVPKSVAERFQQERKALESREPKSGESSQERRIRIAKQLFANEDDFLAKASEGPMHLKDPAVAKIVEDAIRAGSPKRYELLSWCVMSNHVHVLLKPHEALSDITQAMKGASAYQINRLQNQVGRTFWQHDSYDHWSRDGDETLRIIAYIENNPVKAGLCQSPEEWPWSSARLRKEWPMGVPFEVKFAIEGI